MSQRAFIIALASLMLCTGGFVSWVMMESDEQSSESISVVSNKPVAQRVNEQDNVKSNRFTSLTDRSIRWQVRVDQLRRLDASSLNTTEVDYFYTLLHQHPKGHRKEDWWVIVNEVMEQIVQQRIQPERISSEFCSIINDPSLDDVIRDYAVQHISNYVAQDSNATGGSHAEVLNTLTSVIQDPANQHNSIPGTSMMGLVTMSQNPSQISVIKDYFGQLDNYLTLLLEGESSASIVTRTSAINVVGLMESVEYAPTLTKLITTEGTNESVKLSSIAALGDLHKSTTIKEADLQTSQAVAPPQVVELLQGLATGNTKFRFAAVAALKKLQN